MPRVTHIKGITSNGERFNFKLSENAGWTILRLRLAFGHLFEDGQPKKP